LGTLDRGKRAGIVAGIEEFIDAITQRFMPEENVHIVILYE
jgi:hypothetical protein